MLALGIIEAPFLSYFGELFSFPKNVLNSCRVIHFRQIGMMHTRPAFPDLVIFGEERVLQQHINFERSRYIEDWKQQQWTCTISPWGSREVLHSYYYTR